MTTLKTIENLIIKTNLKMNTSSKKEAHNQFILARNEAIIESLRDTNYLKRNL